MRVHKSLGLGNGLDEHRTAVRELTGDELGLVAGGEDGGGCGGEGCSDGGGEG